ncbi:hypothetical protein MNV_1190010 [Candidatus Methanoperedens nitroreducens]|uniref:Uncharacterized protein n=1 Tax=Candidatus Methanoperedens nitratireducens TaxID=1392998 RepID=A0A284VJN3_9EURY|nr:hypothetical protein MNV_1190010 [Candidatus Methanoperedens nitroreducens]
MWFMLSAFSVNWYENRHYLNNELVRTDTNSRNRSSYEFVSVRC